MRLLLFAICMLASTFLFSQNTNIQQPTSVNEDGAAPDASAILDVQATDKGMLTPRMTTAQRTAIATPAAGLLVYDTETNSYWYFDSGIWNEIVSTTVPGESSSSTANKAIPDNTPPPGILDTIALAQPGVIEANTKIKVCVNITHPWTGALDISLIGPDLTTIDLSSNNGESGDNYTSACFSTRANNSITTGSAPFTGNWMPEEPFSNFLGKPIAGLWVLKVIDEDGIVDNGTFDSWSLEISPESAAASLLSDEDCDTKIQVEKTADDDRIRFDVAGTQAMLIDSSGKVGIGTTSPASKLDVEGGMSIGASYSGTSAAPANGAIIQGNVGIGTDTPSELLEVKNTSGAASIRLESGGASGAATFHMKSPESHYSLVADGSSDQFRVQNSNTSENALVILGNNNVGIGTTSPASKLDVEGGMSIGASYSGTSAAPANGAIIQGNVGIGTSSPRLQLHINPTTSGLATDLSDFGTGLVITGSTPRPRLYFEHTLAPIGKKVMMAEMIDGRLIWYSLNDDATGFEQANILVLESGGNVGIKRIPATNRLEVDGNASKSTHGEWLANSDARLKKNIRPLDSEDVLEKMLALRGITYEWDDDQTGSTRPEGTMYGFTAQNIQEVFPELVTEDNLGFLQTAYGTYDAMTVEAIRALNDKIEILKNKNAELESQLSEMDDLKNRMAKLEAALSQDHGGTSGKMSED